MPIPDLLAGVFGQLPEELRTQVTAALDAPEAAPVVAELTNGFKRQSDYSRAMDEARAERERAQALYESNQRWYEQNAAALAAVRDGKPAPTVTPQSTAAPPQTFTREEVEAMVASKLDAFGADALGVVTATNDLAFRHYQEFGERLNMQELVVEAGKARLSLQQAYDQKYHDRYVEKAQKAAAAERAQLIAETEARVRAEAAASPYPVRPSMGPDTLSGLSVDASKANDFTVAAAAAEYEARRIARETAGI